MIFDLLDGDVHTSEIEWTKPSPHAFRASDAVGVHVPHSRISADQVGHTQGRPDAVVHALGEITEGVAGWR